MCLWFLFFSTLCFLIVLDFVVVSSVLVVINYKLMALMARCISKRYDIPKVWHSYATYRLNWDTFNGNKIEVIFLLKPFIFIHKWVYVCVWMWCGNAHRLLMSTENECIAYSGLYFTHAHEHTHKMSSKIKLFII